MESYVAAEGGLVRISPETVERAKSLAALERERAAAQAEQTEE